MTSSDKSVPSQGNTSSHTNSKNPLSNTDFLPPVARTNDFRLEYVYLINPKDHKLIFLILVEKGYKKETGFALLDKMRTTFLDMFPISRIEKAKAFSLAKEFKSEIRALIVKS